jgi:hypothetical protein
MLGNALFYSSVSIRFYFIFPYIHVCRGIQHNSNNIGSGSNKKLQQTESIIPSRFYHVFYLERKFFCSKRKNKISTFRCVKIFQLWIFNFLWARFFFIHFYFIIIVVVLLFHSNLLWHIKSVRRDIIKEETLIE